MTNIAKPTDKPANPNYSSGPCAKHPGWRAAALEYPATVGRSHRGKPCVQRMKDLCDQSKSLLGIPDDYKIAIVAGSDTGAVEIAMWNMLGARGVDVLAWDVFGMDWVKDAENHLKLDDLRTFTAPYGDLPDLSQADSDRDVVFTWNGTTGGVKVPHTDWIKDDRRGLTICDATSAVFAMPIPWKKLDVITWSWQKGLGSEGAHGMLALSPRAIERLNTFQPENRPLPKLFRLTKNGQVNAGLFEGKPINTPSMLAVEDCLSALNWIESIGGVNAAIKRSEDNLKIVESWIEKTDWAEFLARDPAYRSNTSICFKIATPCMQDLDEDGQRAIYKGVEKLLEDEGIAYDFANHRNSIPSFRIWGGPTIEGSDIKKLLPWIDWGVAQVRTKLKDESQKSKEFGT